jgi:hypothetical protein
MTSSHERKSVGLQLFCVMLPHLSSADVPSVFSPNFMRTVANSLRDKERYLHKSAAKCINRLVEWAEASHTSSDSAGGGLLLAGRHLSGECTSAAAVLVLTALHCFFCCLLFLNAHHASTFTGLCQASA